MCGYFVHAIIGQFDGVFIPTLMIGVGINFSDAYVFFKKSCSAVVLQPNALLENRAPHQGSGVALFPTYMITASMYGAMASNIGKSLAVTSSVNFFSVT